MKSQTINRVSLYRKTLVALTAVLALALSVICFRANAFAEEGSAAGMTISVTGEITGLDDQTEELIRSGQIDIRVSPTEDGGVLNADLWVGDYDLFSLLASVDAENLNIQIPQADGNVYTIRGEKILDLITQATGSGSEGGNPLSALQLPEISPEEYQEILTPYLQLLTENLTESLSMAQGETAELVKLGLTVDNCTLYTYQPSAESVEKLLNGVADTMEQDTALENVVGQWTEFLENNSEIINLTGAGGQSVDVADAAAQIREGYASLPALIRENAATIGQTLEAVNFRVLVYVDANGMPVMIEGLGENEGQNLRIAFELQAAEDDIQYYLGADVAGSEIYTSGHTTENNGMIEGTHNAVSDGQTLCEVTYTVDGNSTSGIGLPYFDFDLNTPEFAAGLDLLEDGAGGDTLELSFDAGEEGTAALRINFQKSVDEIRVPEGTQVDISDYSVDEYMSLVSDIASKIFSSMSDENAA